MHYILYVRCVPAMSVFCLPHCHHSCQCDLQCHWCGIFLFFCSVLLFC